MSMDNAERFLRECAIDGSVRDRAYAEALKGDLREWLSRSGYGFTSLDLGNTVRRLKLSARDEEEALLYDELRLWYELLSGEGEDSGGNGVCGPSLCASCSSPSCASYGGGVRS